MTWKLTPELKHGIRTVTLLLAVLLFLQQPQPIVGAAQLQNRQIRLSTSTPGASATHVFSFDISSSGVIGSIVLEYCSNSPLLANTCVAPVGLDLTVASLASQSGQTGFVINGSSTANKFVLSRIPVAAVSGPVSYIFDDAINPTINNQSNFVRLSTYASNNGSGSAIDYGAVVFSTSGGLGASAYVPPFLIFCAGVVVAPDCSSSIGYSIDLGELSKTAANTATTEVNGATNSVNGMVISVLGTTMTSGNNIIPALSTPTTSSPGTSQFGINLRSNSSPAVGVDTSGSGTTFPTTNYDTPNKFTFIPGDNIANSIYSTEFNVLTISYLINVSSGQAPGLYSTTLTYLATVQF